MDYTKLKFVQARWYEKKKAGERPINLIVLHTAECSESPLGAENVANYFKHTETKVSAHYCIDNNSIVQCLQTKDVAWAARSRGNLTGIHIELSGYAAQTPNQWRDAYSSKMLDLAAGLVAFLNIKFNIPAEFVNAGGVYSGQKGITTHREITWAWGGTHTDPGHNFPMQEFIARVRANLEGN